MKPFLVMLLVLVQLATASRAFAGSDAPPLPIETIPPGEDKIVPLRKGEAAPFEGQLFDNNTSLRWAFWLQQYKHRLGADVRLEREACRAETKYRGAILVVEQKKAADIEKDLMARLQRSEKARLVAEEEARSPAWYKTTWFGVVLGVAGTSAAVALSVWAVNAAK